MALFAATATYADHADDNVVFSTYVAIEGDIQLPTTLSGTFIIRVIRDDEVFEGEIEL